MGQNFLDGSNRSEALGFCKTAAELENFYLRNISPADRQGPLAVAALGACTESISALARNLRELADNMDTEARGAVDNVDLNRLVGLAGCLTVFLGDLVTIQRVALETLVERTAADEPSLSIQ